MGPKRTASDGDNDASACSKSAELAALRRAAFEKPPRDNELSDEHHDEVAALLAGGLNLGESGRQLTAAAMAPWKDFHPKLSDDNSLWMCPPKLRQSVLKWTAVVDPDWDPSAPLMRRRCDNRRETA